MTGSEYRFGVRLDLDGLMKIMPSGYTFVWGVYWSCKDKGKNRLSPVGFVLAVNGYIINGNLRAKD